MLVSEYIVQKLKENGITMCFGYPGGMVTFLMDALAKEKNMNVKLLHHEQSAAFAACGYAQTCNRPAMVFATSGPGATNLITGIANAWFDSIPVVFITGQVSTSQQKKERNIRQHGFQETDIVSLVKNITKYTVKIERASQISDELQKCIELCQMGRKGPVLLDIPIDVQKNQMDINITSTIQKNKIVVKDEVATIAKEIMMTLQQEEKPLLLLGNGAHNISKKKLALLINHLGMPVVTTLAATDLNGLVKQQSYGFIGSYGLRTANTIIDKCSLILSFGARLSIRQTGEQTKLFAPNAKLIRIDIDEKELAYSIKSDEKTYCCDVCELCDQLLKEERIVDRTEWLNICNQISQYIDHYDQSEGTDIIDKLGEKAPDNCVVVTDVGQNQIWTAQAFPFQPNQIFVYSAGLGAMGYALPAAIGSYYACHRPILCISGDGGFQMNIQELETIKRENIPITVVVLNNHALGMIRHFQELYFEDREFFTTNSGGYSTPDFSKIAKAYGLEAHTVDVKKWDLKNWNIETNNAVLWNINLSSKTYVLPKSIFNKPLSFQLPPLSTNIREKIDAL